MAELVAAAGFERIESRPDLAGIERVVVGRGERASRSSATAPTGASALERCVGGGGVALFPADGLYGLACDPPAPTAIERIHGLKGRDDGKPSAVMYFSPLAMRELIAALGPRTRDALGALLPGPVTLVVANPQRRYPLACREDPERLGLRLIERAARRRGGAGLPDLRQPQRRAGAGALRRRRPGDPSTPSTWRSTAASSPAMPSTVVDLTEIEAGGEPVILREGALSSQEAAAAARACSSVVKNSSRDQLPVGRRRQPDRAAAAASIPLARPRARITNSTSTRPSSTVDRTASRSARRVHDVEEGVPLAAHALGPAVDVGLARELARGGHLELARR